MPRADRPRCLSRRVPFKGRVFRVESDRVVLANGRRAQLDVVRHRGSVVMIAQPSPRQIVLVRQFRYAVGRWIWELPAGTLEPGEAPRRAARRECEEEIGWRPRRIERLGAYYPTPGFCDEIMIFFHCTDLVAPRQPAPRDEDEQIEPRTFSLREVGSMLARRGSVDMKTVLGLRLLDRARRQRG